jgi:hypothetical protein
MIVLWFLAGGAVEVLNMFTRKWFVERAPALGTGSVAVLFLAGVLLRVSGTALVLALGFRHSVASGAAALVGYLVGRWCTVWWVHRRHT